MYGIIMNMILFSVCQEGLKDPNNHGTDSNVAIVTSTWVWVSSLRYHEL